MYTPATPSMKTIPPIFHRETMGKGDYGKTYAEALASGLQLLCRMDPCLRGVVDNGRNGWQYEDSGQFLDCLAQFYRKVAQVYEERTDWKRSVTDICYRDLKFWILYRTICGRLLAIRSCR